jgi:hypothetical protein
MTDRHTHPKRDSSNDPDGRPRPEQARWDPPGAVVFAGTTTADCCHAADRTCGYINFFTSARAAHAWARASPAVTGEVLRRARALRRGVAEFGAFMRTADGTGPDRT